MPTITLTVTAPQAQRIATAFGRAYHLANPDGTPRDATAQEMHGYLVGYIKGVVLDTETAAAKAAINVPDLGGVT